MPWVEFWNDLMHGYSDKKSIYTFYEILPSEEDLKDTSEDLIPYGRRESEKGCAYGFDVHDPLSEDLKNNLIKNYKNKILSYKSNIEHCKRILKILGDNDE